MACANKKAGVSFLYHMKKLAAIALLICSTWLNSYGQKEIKAVLELKDSLFFRDLFEPFKVRSSVKVDSLVNYKEAFQHLHFIDSIAGISLLIFERNNDESSPDNRFYLGIKTGQHIHMTAFTTYLKGRYSGYEIHSLNDQPLLELQYTNEDVKASGTYEIRMSAFFTMNKGYVQPVARLVKSFWKNQNGKYNPGCKDFSFMSTEMQRNIRVKQNTIRVSRASLVMAQNIDCEYSKTEEILSGGIFEWTNDQFTRK